MKKIIYLFIIVVLFIAGKILLRGDFNSFLQWWITILYIGIIFMPLATLIFNNFNDKGYLFSKTIGVAVIGYVMWLFSSLHLMKFTVASCMISVIIALILNCIIIAIRKKYNVNQHSNRQFNLYNYFKNDKTLDTIIAEELLFFTLFLLFTYVRGFKPEAYGTEKFMDYGFMTSMMRNDYMPPQDFWFSGTKLNYYYVSQFIATFLTKLSTVKVSSGYNLMLMMVGAFAFILPYSLVYNIMQQFSKARGKVHTFISIISGFIGGCAVLLAGNMHYPTFQWFQPLFQKFFGLKVTDVNYWFPEATRFIGYHPDTHDKTIHEFPAYSFVLGDLHAHVINIMFVLPVLAILFSWMCSRREQQSIPKKLTREVFHPSILLISFFIGLFHTTNYWDYPIYFIVSGAIILFTNLIVYNFNRKALLVTALQGLVVMIISQIVCLTFTINFDKMATTPLLCIAHTPINQFIILWGLPVYVVFAFVIINISDYNKNRKNTQSLYEGKDISYLQKLFSYLTSSDLFIITIGLCALGLVLIPEIIYIKDIYNGDYKRANTMFKLTYQAFIMFGICFGYIFLRLLCFGKSMKQKKIALVCIILFALSLGYIQNAVNSWYGNIFKTEGYKGLDASAFMKTTMPDDYLAINWMNENITGNPVILEAPGKISYTDYERVSVMTGLPTVLGWYDHEWLWKSDTSSLDKRESDIEEIYTGKDASKTRALIKKYNISYLYIGKLEKEMYPSLNYKFLKNFGDVVYSNETDGNKKYETYIIRISSPTR